MDDAKCELVRNWLLKAQHDLAAARRLAAGSDPLLDVAAYHCQQAGEKAVKAFLVFHDHRFQRTHDVEAIASAAQAYEAGFSSWLDAARLLTPYATAFRYPGEAAAPDAEEFAAAEKAASALLEFVCSLLPSEARPR